MHLLMFSKEALNGGRLRSSGSGSFKGIIKSYKENFENFPIDKDGNIVPLMDFEYMSIENLVLWKNHVVNSFTEGVQYAPRFRFIRKDGSHPELTMMKRGPAPAVQKAVKAKKQSKSSGVEEVWVSAVVKQAHLMVFQGQGQEAKVEKQASS